MRRDKRSHRVLCRHLQRTDTQHYQGDSTVALAVKAYDNAIMGEMKYMARDIDELSSTLLVQGTMLQTMATAVCTGCETVGQTIKYFDLVDDKLQGGLQVHRFLARDKLKDTEPSDEKDVKASLRQVDDMVCRDLYPTIQTFRPMHGMNSSPAVDKIAVRVWKGHVKGIGNQQAECTCRMVLFDGTPVFHATMMHDGQDEIMSQEQLFGRREFSKEEHGAHLQVHRLTDINDEMKYKFIGGDNLTWKQGGMQHESEEMHEWAVSRLRHHAFHSWEHGADGDVRTNSYDTMTWSRVYGDEHWNVFVACTGQEIYLVSITFNRLQPDGNESQVPPSVMGSTARGQAVDHTPEESGVSHGQGKPPDTVTVYIGDVLKDEEHDKNKAEDVVCSDGVERCITDLDKDVISDDEIKEKCFKDMEQACKEEPSQRLKEGRICVDTMSATEGPRNKGMMYQRKYPRQRTETFVSRVYVGETAVYTACYITRHYKIHERRAGAYNAEDNDHKSYEKKLFGIACDPQSDPIQYFQQAVLTTYTIKGNEPVRTGMIKIRMGGEALDTIPGERLQQIMVAYTRAHSTSVHINDIRGYKGELSGWKRVYGDLSLEVYSCTIQDNQCMLVVVDENQTNDGMKNAEWKEKMEAGHDRTDAGMQDRGAWYPPRGITGARVQSRTTVYDSPSPPRHARDTGVQYRMIGYESPDMEWGTAAGVNTATPPPAAGLLRVGGGASRWSLP